MKAAFARHRGLFVGAGLALIALVVFVAVWFQPQKLFIDERVSEAAPSSSAGGSPAAPAAVGKFRPLDHDVRGSAQLIALDDGKRFVRFTEDFTVENGPDLVVYLSAAPADAAGRAFTEDFIDLGKLKGNVGAQNYEIPATADASRYRSVVVWCRRFSVGFAVAPLEA